MNKGLLSWSPFTPIPFPFTTGFNTKIPKLITSAITATLNSVDEASLLTARERRQMRNERRELKPAYDWKDDVETKLIKKTKKRYATWTEELNLDTLAELGPQWWVVRVSRVSGHETAERLARALVRNFPNMEFKLYLPSVQIKRKLKNGTISVKPKPLFPGCAFFQCVMNRELHDFIRDCDGVGGFLGSKVGNTKRQINKPRPVDADDMEAITKQAKEEQEKADQDFEQEQKQLEAMELEKLGEEGSPLVSKAVTQPKTKGRGRKATKEPILGKDASILVPGSTVRVVSGSFAGFSGILKKIDKTGLATVGFTLFGKETLTDIDVKEISAETK